MKVAILQSSYIPWKGYFDLINSVDEFILYDDAQFTKRDWRNRNKIKTAKGDQWLSIPVLVKGKFNQSIYETHAVNSHWQMKHWKMIEHAYSKAPCFETFKQSFESFYESNQTLSLSNINSQLIKKINHILGIKTKISQSKDYKINNLGKPSEKLLELCIKSGANSYLSGPAAKKYLETDLFKENGVGVEWYSYDHYPQYPQLYPPFNHHVSILDLIFNMGNKSKRYMQSFII